jgi:hypothetical protein
MSFLVNLRLRSHQILRSPVAPNDAHQRERLLVNAHAYPQDLKLVSCYDFHSSRRFPRNPYMAAVTCACCNSGAISWVPVLISTTYWVALLTAAARNRKVSTFPPAETRVQNGRRDRCNHLSKHLSEISARHYLRVSPVAGSAVFQASSFWAQGECGA